MMCAYPRLEFLCWAFLFFTVPMTLPASADELDALLNPGGESGDLVDDSATKAWDEVVNAFRRNDLEKARQLGSAFLEADHRTSPYQLLGVQVMLGLANADNPAVSKNATHDAELKLLMDERDQLRARYASLQALTNKENAVINRHTRNRTQPVQAGTQAYRECAASAAVIDQSNAAMAEMQPSIEANKLKVSQHEVGTTTNLKNETMRLLDMLIEAGEIEAAFAITNVYVRVAGSDLDIAKKQQDVIRLREDLQTAEKIVAAIAAEVEPLAAAGKGEEAKNKLEMLAARVETSGQSDSVKNIALTKLKVLAMLVASAQKTEQSKADAEAVAKREEDQRVAMAQERADREADAARADKAATAGEINDRLTTLENKLERAQETFGSVIRSIEGFSNFTGDFNAEADKKKMVATLNTKLRSGEVSKEKVDNLVKAKSEHIGILREVEVLRVDEASLSVIQRGRLANLHGTAQTALDFLDEAKP